jgi:hypothetical protein
MFPCAFRSTRRLALATLLVFVMAAVANVAMAAEDCADTPAKLVQYLDKAETQTSPYKIKIVAGNYALPASKTDWFPTASLTIEGGYLDCSNRGAVIADQTVIDTSATQYGINISASGDLSVDGIAFFGGYGQGLTAGDTTGHNGSLTLSSVHFASTKAGWMSVNGTMSLSNILVDHLPTDPITHCSVSIALDGNNTLKAKFVTIETSPGEDVCVVADFPDSHHNNLSIYNSILWPGNIKASTTTWSQGDTLNVSVHNSVLNSFVSNHGTFTESNSIHVDPLWADPPAGDYSLQIPPAPISPAVNMGAPAADIPGGISDADIDIAGNTRVIGSAPDMGAYESPVDESAVYGVTTLTDCSTPLNQPSCGSMRDALARANSPAATAPVKTIRFAIVDASNQPQCPAKIHINSSLPDVTTHVVIDGYTQGAIDQSDPPLSWPNDDPTFFNANLCVEVLGPGSGYGLRVPSGSNGSLTLRGVALGGFTQGVMLAGGANHQIAGNQFGGLTSGFSIYGFSNAGVRVETGTPVIIGGDNPTDRNVFLNANSADNSNAAGVVIGYGANGAQGTCQIVGNLLGISPDGTSADPNNENGVLINGNGCAVRGNYLAGNIKDAIHLLGGSHNVIQKNIIGPRITPGVPFFYNPGFGIHVTNGANDNIIGAGEGFFGPAYSYQNTITQMNAGGIVVANSTGNTVRGNSIYFNGNDVGLNLDLGGDGPTANDAGDADGGPNSANDLMNYPVPNGVVWIGGTGSIDLTVRGQLDAQAGFYQIDAYYDVACSATGRGGGTWVGGAPYTAFFTGTGAFEVPVSIPFFNYDSKEGRVSVTATQLGVAHESTSEFSECLSVDTIFANDFER